jgi:pseudouridine kinase
MTDISAPEKPVLVIGSAALDAKAQAREAMASGGSVPGNIRITVGGVARNIAESLARLEVPTILLSAVGDDSLGEYVLEATARAGVDVSPSVRVPGATTGAYFAQIEPDGRPGWSIDDMAVLEHLTPELITSHSRLIRSARTVVLDNNLPLATLQTIIGHCKEAGVTISIDPTSRFLAPRLIPLLSNFRLIAPNQAEAAVLCDYPVGDVNEALVAAQILVRRGVKLALVTMGDMGVVYATAQERGHVSAPEVDVVDLTGGSHAMTATVVYALLHGFPVDEAVRLAVTAAMLTITSRDTVRSDLSLELLYDSLAV